MISPATTSNEGGSSLPVLRRLRWADELEQAPSTLSDPTPVSEGDNDLGMPQLVNLQEYGLRRSARLAGKHPDGSIK